jgi:tRNA (cytidine/uridine-2'-O-)-methyltransferase
LGALSALRVLSALMMKSSPSVHIVLFEPVIPQNTGSIARLCACTGATLHLIRPLGFSIDEKAVRRAGLDYWPHVDVRDHENWDHFLESEDPKALHFLSKFAERSYVDIEFSPPLYIVFGSETKGLPPWMWERYPERFFTIPMRTHLVRSLNLSQAVAVVAYEALRQNGFPLA